MSETFLDKIVAKTHKRVASAKRDVDPSGIKSNAAQVRSRAEPHRFRRALKRTGRTHIIAEIKRASPSKGIINADIDVAEVARSYESGGAAAISVLTETEFFGGSLTDLTVVSQTAKIPILRKDFIVDEYQIYEAAAFGADAVLLIVAALSEEELIRFQLLTQDELGMDTLVEVHTSEDLAVATEIGANIIGVNNRDLRSLEVSLDVSRRLIAGRPANTLMISESGLSTQDEIEELKGLGFNGFLIGETLMRTGNASDMLGGWI
ncbi:MAG: indole-3-glycerol phosphate synthase TrpC [Pyrinomonadaceae bacterium]